MTILPSVIIRLQLRRQSRDRRGREVGRLLAGRSAPAESRRSTPTKLENRQQRIEAFRSPRPLRQNRRVKRIFRAPEFKPSGQTTPAAFSAQPRPLVEFKRQARSASFPPFSASVAEPNRCARRALRVPPVGAGSGRVK